MFCEKCGNPLTEEGVCPACAANAEPVTPVEEPIVVEAPIVEEAVVEAPQTNPGKTMGIISMILGIFSLLSGTVCSCLLACLGGIPAMITSIVGIVLAIIGMKKSKAAGCKNTMALVGLILSIVTIVIILVFILINAIIGGIGAMSNSYYYY